MTLNLNYKIYTDLCTVYSSAGRYYHNLQHINNCLLELEKFIADNPKEFFLKREVEYALWFHDYVYIPGSKTNEESSARMFLQYSKNFDLCCDESLVEELICGTKTHAIDTTLESKLVNDIDMSILGKHPSIYQAYLLDIKNEFCKTFSEKEFGEGRIKFLDTILAQEKIFKLEYFQNKYEEKARSNLSEEKKIWLAELNRQ